MGYLIRFRDHSAESRYKEAVESILKGAWTIKDMSEEMEDKYKERGSYADRYQSRDSGHDGGMYERDWDEFQEFKAFQERRRRM